ncbi:protein kinase [Streptomyces sp. NPDC049687]|uniref:protein kinase domain-containing protein n=1 Tax=Streptomyces sp. NPDC049687 TaxID=3365596 RepID=UPI0037A7048A
MTDQRPTPPRSTAHEAAALRQTGASPLRVGDPGRVGPYVPLALLGSGGMGRVYLARAADDSPGLFAVKVIRPEYAEDVRFQRRFEREAAVHARLGPPYAPRLCGTGFEDELLWMATDYVPGLDLTDVVQGDGALPTVTVWRLVAELGRALAALSDVGVVHRDLKPSNVLLSVQGTHLIDFGISKAADASALTGTGNRVGTPAYMSPEYLRTGHCDSASDVFSLAGTLVYAATGRAPFGDGTGVDVMHRVAFEEPNPEVTAALSAADPELAALLSGCLAKEPDRRPTAPELIEIAGARAVESDWPEPLLGEVLARQRAYETLHRLPAEQAARLLPSGRRAAATPTPPPGPVSRPAPSGIAASRTSPPAAPGIAAAPSEDVPGLTPGSAEAVSAEAASGRLRLGGARPWTRRKRVLAVAAGAGMCAAVAGVLVLARPDGSATALPPRGVDTATEVVPGDLPSNAALPGTPTVGDRASAAGASSERADVDDAGDSGASQPGASASTAAGSSAPTPGAGSSAGPSSAPDSPSAEPAAQPWNTDCTYYDGNGRTRQGDSGTKVLQVQCMLTKRGYTVGSAGVNGEFGPDTESAVRAFQTDRGLSSDGVVARSTWTALRADD